MTKWHFTEFVFRKRICLTPGVNTYDILSESTLPNSSRITDMTETELIYWLLNTEHNLNMLLRKIGFNYKPLILCEVTHPFIKDSNQTPGDIDVIFFYDNEPKKAVAFQCVRIKVKSDEASDNPNKINDAKHGIKQSNKMLKIYQFYKSYYVVLIEVDASHQKNKNVVHRGLSYVAEQKIYNLPFIHDLDERIGIIYIEIIQPANNSIDNMSNVFIDVRRDARKQAQFDKTTNCVWEIIRNKMH